MNTLTIVFIIIIIALSIAAIKTVIPNSKASKACLVGYRATCSFTPISTIILIAADIAVFLVAKTLTLM
jgi:hypothetical protein